MAILRIRYIGCWRGVRDRTSGPQRTSTFRPRLMSIDSIAFRAPSARLSTPRPRRSVHLAAPTPHAPPHHPSFTHRTHSHTRVPCAQHRRPREEEYSRNPCATPRARPSGLNATCASRAREGKRPQHSMQSPRHVLPRSPLRQRTHGGCGAAGAMQARRHLAKKPSCESTATAWLGAKRSPAVGADAHDGCA